MERVRASLLTATVLAAGIVLGVSGAYAQDSCNPSRSATCTERCGSAGVGSCNASGSQISCVCNETTKDVRGNAFGTATQDTTTGQGNLTDQPGNPTETTCDLNRGQCKQR